MVMNTKIQKVSVGGKFRNFKGRVGFQSQMQKPSACGKIKISKQNICFEIT